MSRSPLFLSVLLATLPVTVSWADTPDPAASARHVDQSLAAELFGSESLKKKAPLVDDATFLRRVFLDLVGEIPTPEDVIAFSLDPAEDKRTRIVDNLLADEAFGTNWGRYWRDVVFYRRSEDRAVVAYDPLAKYLATQFNEGVSWDQIATEMITAEGDVKENGAGGLIVAQGGQPEETVAEISRIFMGIQIQCAQCHDHPTDRWKREQFHQLAAFFPRTAARRSGMGGEFTYTVVGSDRFPRFRRSMNNNRFIGTAEHQMPDLANPADPGKTMQPVFFVTGDRLSKGTTDAIRRGTLASWMTSPENSWFAAAYVNRMWSELVGEGFYEPVDDMGPDRQCSAPETMNLLVKDFVASGHDVKWLFRAIMSTEAYQRESRGRRELDETPFLANCSQRLRGDQLYSALVAVLGVPEQGRGGARRGPYGGGPRTFFNQIFGFDPSEHREEVSGSIPQALAMMNSPQINIMISARPGTRLNRMLQTIDEDDDLTVEIYLTALARQPSDDELATCLEYVKEVGNRSEAFEDILWSLINSTEFHHRR